VNEPVPLILEDAPRIAAFTRVACPYDLLTTTSVERSIFADPGPQIVLGLYDGGLDAIGAAVMRGPVGFVKFLAVHPSVQRSGVGTELLEHLEAFCLDKGATEIHVGTSAPYYVIPGVDVRATEGVCFLETRGYHKIGDAVNLGVRLADLPDPPFPCHTATDEDLERLLPWVKEAHPNWIDELTRAVHLGTCVVYRDLGFACFDVNREGWFGPIATIASERAKGVGAATLLAALSAMRFRGHERAEIAWATALPFYMKTIGSRISRVFWMYRKKL
jgi:mycothiol synthase